MEGYSTHRGHVRCGYMAGTCWFPTFIAAHFALGSALFCARPKLKPRPIRSRRLPHCTNAYAWADSTKRKLPSGWDQVSAPFLQFTFLCRCGGSRVGKLSHVNESAVTRGQH